ncbi:unnamed protein product [Heterobilharzia americana]|nr:unnamed protein product [Heterobilharzia americana]
MADVAVYHGDAKGLEVVPNERYNQFLNIWKFMSSRIEDSHNSWLSSHSSKASHVHNTDQIPTAVLLAGVNTPDHSVIYGHLKSLVLEDNGHVAVISPGANTTSVRSLVSLVVQQLSSDSSSGSWFEKDDISKDDLIVTENFTPATCFSYLALMEWYYSRTQNCSGLFEPSGEFKTPAPLTTSPSGFQRSISQAGSYKHRPHPSTSTSPRSTTSRRSHRFSLRSNADSTENTVKSGLVDSVSTSLELEKFSDPKQKLSLRPLVIILTEIESIPVQVLCDFIELTSLYAAGQIRGRSYALPISFVFGLSTTPETVFESRINASTLSRLTIRRFTVPPPSAFLEVAMKEIIQFPGVHPTYSVLSYLIDGIFLCLDYSVKNFLQRLKFCMLEHYLKTPHPELLLPYESMHTYLTSLTYRELTQIVCIDYPSLADCHLNTMKTRTSSIGTADPSSSSSPNLSPRSCEHYAIFKFTFTLTISYSTFIELVIAIITPVSVRPLGKNIGDLYRLWLKNGLASSEEFNLTMNLLGKIAGVDQLWSIHSSSLSLWISKEMFVNSVHNAYTYLVKESTCIIQSSNVASLWPRSIELEAHKSLNELADATLSWHTKLSTASQETINKQSQSADCEMSTPRQTPPLPSKPIGFDKKRKISLRTLRQHLQEYAASSPSHSDVISSPCAHNKTEWDMTRKEFLSWIQTKLIELIPWANKLPLHEVFYGPPLEYNPPSDQSIHSQLALSIRRRLNPPLQRCLHQALVNPGIYLQIPDFKLSSSSNISSKLFDLCILYKLLIETSSMVNLYDWLLAFATILGEKVDMNNPPSQEVQSRFLQGLAELQLLGCIKSTRRKTDHVIRLTWITGLM